MLAAGICGTPVRTHTFTGQVWATRKDLMRNILIGMDRLLAACASDVHADSESQA